MFRRIGFVLITLFLLLIPLGCSSNEKAPQTPTSSSSPKPSDGQKTELMISAAASLKDALNEIKTSFEQEHPNTSVTYNFGSSGKLAQQVEQGVPADVFLSASKKDMDTLQEKNLIVKDSRVDFAKNELALITNKDNPLTVSSFEDIDPDNIKHFAIGEPQSVPAGRYTQETFQTLHLWDKLQSKLVYGNDVRQVLTYVESGNAEVGVVYSTDALVSKKVKILATAKPEWHKPIIYPAATIISSPHKDEAKAFITYLSSEKGKETLSKYGFK